MNFGFANSAGIGHTHVGADVPVRPSRVDAGDWPALAATRFGYSGRPRPRGVQDLGTAGALARGYTLLEIVVVVAVLAVAAAVVTPSVTRAFGNVELKLAASSVAATFAQARTHALYEGRSYAVLFGPSDVPQRSLYLVRDDGHPLRSITLPRRVSLLAQRPDGEWSPDLTAVYFFPDGSSQSAQIDLRGDRHNHVQIALSPITGRARISALKTEDE